MMQVVDLLRQGRAAPRHFSALDAVMGKDWAIVEPGRPRRVRESNGGLALRAAHKRNVNRMGGGSGLPGRKPQAVVKMVRNGGVSDAGGMKAQIAYLSRDGKQPLERSEALMGVEVDADQAADMEKTWRMPPEGSGRADRTSHFIVSFPEDTIHGAAKRAGREWAEEMFGSGNYGGDSYDYYTAFHTDRSHPHMHVVVLRRGLDHGEWLKVSQRGDMNYDKMREVLVAVADREGIELEATPRLARGVHDRAVPDAEYRLAAKEGRSPVAPKHTTETATLAAAALLHQSRRFAVQAQLVEGRSPQAARVFYAASAAASEGKALADITTKITNGQEKDMNTRVEVAKAEIRDDIDKMDRGIGKVSDSATRMRLAREVATLKAETAPLLSNPQDLVPFTEPGAGERFKGFEANDPNAVAARSAVETRVRAVATRYGVDPDGTIERYAGPAPSKGLEQQFERAEVEERARTRVTRGEGPEDVQARDAALSKMHREIGSIYGAARSRDSGAIAPDRDEAPATSARADNTTPQQDAQTRQTRETQAQAQEEAARTAAREANPIYREVMAEKAAEKRSAAQRDAEKKQQDRADAERAQRERDSNGRGL